MKMNSSEEFQNVDSTRVAILELIDKGKRQSDISATNPTSNQSEMEHGTMRCKEVPSQISMDSCPISTQGNLQIRI